MPKPASGTTSTAASTTAPSSSTAAANPKSNDMAPLLSTLDVFILTFNCAKTLIEPNVFAAHLHGALTHRNTSGSELPDLVVFSLQEIAPLSYSFIGSYFLSPYYARFSEALNLASSWALGNGDPPATASSSSPPDAATTAAGTRRRAASSPSPYTLVRAKNVGMTAMLLYARDPSAVTAIAEAECGFGAADMGNKGAVGLRVTWRDGRSSSSSSSSSAGRQGPSKSTELTFVAAHLAAMEWNLKKRNDNWRSIASALTFANPRDILPAEIWPEQPPEPMPDRSGAGDNHPPPKKKKKIMRLPTGDSPDPSEEEEPLVNDDDETASESDAGDQGEETDTHPLLHIRRSEGSPALTPSQTAALHALSIYKPTTHLFVAGDLNYRIGSRTPPPGAAFPSFDPRAPAERQFAAFLPRDQLTRERTAGRTLHGLSEAEVKFGPTYKFDVLDSWPDEEEGQEGEDGQGQRWTQSGEVMRQPQNGLEAVPWRFAPHRWPGWCDRVLYWEVPRWVGERVGRDGVKVEVLEYDALPLMKTSDHRAVYFRARVPVLSEEEFSPPEELLELQQDGAAASTSSSVSSAVTEEERPRLRLPIPIDVHAWERRAVARRKEVVVGWSAMVWSTREGAAAMGTALAVGAVGWWVWKAWF